MTKAIRIHEQGSPDVMKWEDIDVGDPGAGEIRVRHSAVGLNFIDCYHRSGLYPLAKLPAVLGMEGAGVVEAIGDGVTGLAVGQRVVYAQPMGSYCEARLMPAERAVALPDAITDKTAAAMMLQGTTVEYLIRRTYPVKSGDTVVFHAAAGGVGLIACQWLKHLGATVIGTVGSDEKAELAKANGCDHPIVYTRDNFTEKVKELTDGAGVPVVFDSIGKDTFTASLECLRPRGMLVSFGSASGNVDAFGLGELMSRGSLYVTRPSLMSYVASRQELVDSAAALFDVVQGGQVNITVNQTYPLAEAAQAHRDLEGRKTTGSTVLEP
jgi:NADPH2:quinone reductase